MRTKANQTRSTISVPSAPMGISIGEHVRTTLREAILKLELLPGSVIDKDALAEQLGVSKFPVTDALSKLQDEGLVDVRSRSGTTVTPIKAHEVQQAAFIRRSLEIEAARALAPAASDELVAALALNLRYQRSAIKARDRAGFHEFDLEFHAIILRHLKLARVQQLSEIWRGQLDRVRRLHTLQRDHRVLLGEHARVQEAFAARDGDAAADAIRRHLDAGLHDLMTFMSAHAAEYGLAEDESVR